MKRLLLLMCLLLVAACSPQSSAPAVLVTPDTGDVGRFLNCAAEPQRELSAREQCEVAAFKSRCSVLDDCFVRCINSASASFVGGRCAHMCTLHEGTLPSDALAHCATIAGRSGVDVE